RGGGAFWRCQPHATMPGWNAACLRFQGSMPTGPGFTSEKTRSIIAARSAGCARDCPRREQTSRGRWPMRGPLTLPALFVLAGAATQASAQASGTQTGSAQSPPPPPTRLLRPAPPARDPHTPGYVAATELPDGAVPSPTVDGNFIIGPTHPPAPEMTIR